MKAAKDDVTNGPAVVSSPPQRATASYPPNGNWAGPVAYNETYYDAQGTFNVPTPYQSDGYYRVSSQWIGNGGNCGSGCGGQLVQAGTEVDTQGSSTYYDAWFELYPDQPYEIVISQLEIRLGDEMFVSISTTRHQSYIYVEDETTGGYYSVPPAYTADGCTCPSGEGIEEHSGTSGNDPMTFDNRVYFNGVAIAGSSGDQYIDNLPWYATAVTNGSGQIEALTSAPQGSGYYWVNRYNNN